jgi:Flp pilus assembly protein TadD
MEAAMDTQEANKVVRRLAAAEGYLQLDLPRYALAELDAVTDAGPLEAIAQLFRGEALQAQANFADAIDPLRRAAELFPAPFNQRALMDLSLCYREQGEVALADQAEADAAPPLGPDGKPLEIRLMVLPIFEVQSGKDPFGRRSSQ